MRDHEVGEPVSMIRELKGLFVLSVTGVTLGLVVQGCIRMQNAVIINEMTTTCEVVFKDRKWSIPPKTAYQVTVVSHEEPDYRVSCGGQNSSGTLSASDYFNGDTWVFRITTSGVRPVARP